MAKTELHRKLWSSSGTTHENSDLEAVLGERTVTETVFLHCYLFLFRGMDRRDTSWLGVA